MWEKTTKNTLCENRNDNNNNTKNMLKLLKKI